MPTRYRFWRWIRDDPDFRAVVQRACEDRDDYLLEQAMELFATPGPAARRQRKAILNRLAQLRPYPGERYGLSSDRKG
jgi:hypothetical protein